MNIESNRRKMVLNQLAEMNDDAEAMGINTEHARRFVRAAEDALAVREFFFVADRSTEFKAKWGDVLSKLNAEYAEVRYFREKMGYPLDWSSQTK